MFTLLEYMDMDMDMDMVLFIKVLLHPLPRLIVDAVEGVVER